MIAEYFLFFLIEPFRLLIFYWWVLLRLIPYMMEDTFIPYDDPFSLRYVCLTCPPDQNYWIDVILVVVACGFYLGVIGEAMSKRFPKHAERYATILTCDKACTLALLALAAAMELACCPSYCD